MRRARLIAVAATVAVGALGVISSTQTWLWVLLQDGSSALAVPGASAIAVLAPLSLAVLALGGALSIVGLILRCIFGALALTIAALLAWLTAQVAFFHPTSAVASTVTEATGISGEDAVAGLVAQIDSTAWPFVTLAAWILLLGTGVFTLVTASRWHGSGRRYRTDAAAPRATATAPASRPHDAIDSWDDLSRGDDPTA